MTAIPSSARKAFVAAGAQRLHVIDLDGAFGSGENLAAVERICERGERPGTNRRRPASRQARRRRLCRRRFRNHLGTLLVEDERLARNIISRFAGK